MSKRFLVSGAGGFIGSHLVEKLVRDGHEVRAFIEYNSTGNLGWLETCAEDVKGNFEVSMGDVRDKETVSSALANVEGVFHLAALIAIPYSYTAFESYVDVNVKGTLNVLNAAHKAGVEKLIHTSTSEAFGTAQYVPMDEAHPLVGQSPYAASKISADAFAQACARSFDLNVGIVRPFNTFGPRQSARAFIPTVITQLLTGKGELNLGSLDVSRDFTFVSDTVNGFVKAYFSDFGYGDDINLGSGSETWLLDLVEKLKKFCGREDAKIISDPERIRPSRSEVSRLLADNSKARASIGWAPNLVGDQGFNKGLELTVDWFREKKNLDLYKPSSYAI